MNIHPKQYPGKRAQFLDLITIYGILASLAFGLTCQTAFASAWGATLNTKEVQIGKGSFPHLVDLDGDDDLDIVAMNDIAPTRQPVYMPIWYENEGTTWTEHMIIDWEAMDMNIEPVDLDRDGDLDLVICVGGILRWTEGMTLLGWLENDGTRPPKFTPHPLASFPPNLGLYSFCPADMDRDGDMDLIVNYGSTNPYKDEGDLYLYENNGATSPKFMPRPLIKTTRPYHNRLKVGDVNGDRWPDVLMGTYQSGTFLYQHPESDAEDFTQILISNGVGQIHTTDINGDGRTDVLVGYTWCENRGTTFTTHLLAPELSLKEYDRGEVVVNEKTGLIITNTPDHKTFSHNMRWLKNDMKSSPTMKSQGILNRNKFKNICIGDVNGDGIDEVVVARDDDKLFIIARMP